jgi:hypothetical protein
VHGGVGGQFARHESGRFSEDQVALHDGAGNVVNAIVVLSGVVAQCMERVIDGGPSSGSEHAFGLLDDEPRV